MTAQTNGLIPGTTTVELLTDRSKMNELEVPADVPAVVVITNGRCRHVLDIKTIQSIASEYAGRDTK